MARIGGSFKKANKNSKAVQVDAAKDHPDGNRPRDAKGRPLDQSRLLNKQARKKANAKKSVPAVEAKA